MNVARQLLNLMNPEPKSLRELFPGTFPFKVRRLVETYNYSCSRCNIRYSGDVGEEITLLSLSLDGSGYQWCHCRTNSRDIRWDLRRFESV